MQVEGPEERFTGGHTKISELMAKAVHAGVTEAVFKQNGLGADRSVFQRLADRKLSIEQIARYYSADTDPQGLAGALEEVLMNAYYASFLKSAMAVSDDHQKGLLPQLAVFDDLCCSVAGRLSGRSGYSAGDFPMVEGMPVVMAKAFGALVVGIRDKADQRTVP